MKKVKSFPLVLLLILVFTINIGSVAADITNVSVTPQIDTGDTDKFEMVVKPGDKRTLTIAFTNFGSAVERLKIQPTNAQTDATGNFVYNQVVKKGTNGLAAAFADMTTKKTITLQPQESKTETLVVSTPTEKFDGVIYGGLNIYSVNANGDQINSESTPIPVIITQTNENVAGSGKITGIEGQAIAYQPNIVIKLANNKPGEARNVSYNLMIQRKGMFSFLGFNGRKVPVYQSDLTIAPNSTLPIPVNYKQQPLTPGEYMVTGSFTINGKAHKVNETYKISKSQAEKVNKQSKGLIYDKTWIFILVIIGLVILIGVVIFLIVRQIKYNRREENNRLVAESDKILKAEQPQEEPVQNKTTGMSYGQSNVQNNQRTNQNPYVNNQPQMPYQGPNQPAYNSQNGYPNQGNQNFAPQNLQPQYQNQSRAPYSGQQPNMGSQNPMNNQGIPNFDPMNQNVNQAQGNNVNYNQQNFPPSNGQNGNPWQQPQGQVNPQMNGQYQQPTGNIPPQTPPNNNVQPQNQYNGQVPNPNNVGSQPTMNNIAQQQNYNPQANVTNQTPPNNNAAGDQQDGGWDDISLDDLLKKH